MLSIFECSEFEIHIRENKRINLFSVKKIKTNHTTKIFVGKFLNKEDIAKYGSIHLDNQEKQTKLGMNIYNLYHECTQNNMSWSIMIILKRSKLCYHPCRWNDSEADCW